MASIVGCCSASSCNALPAAILAMERTGALRRLNEGTDVLERRLEAWKATRRVANLNAMVDITLSTAQWIVVVIVASVGR